MEVNSKGLYLYNTLSKKKEYFEPLNPPFVGMYVCGPTVYGDPHLGHARPAITFDIVFRYLKYLGYKVRYVRNITDVGHLENDADEGEDKIAKKAKLEQLEPMEIVHYYTNRYHEFMRELNVLPPSIEPFASGHIIEQIDMIEKIIENGYGYVSGGSVYFDVEKYNQDYKYGELSGRVLEDLVGGTRELEGQSEKKNPFDFALWKKASKEHIMRWPSPWSIGFPGWHLECSTMSTKYLGVPFDIHGGGMDLLFPHHECEIAQSVGSEGIEPVRYWMHNNMITINGQKMGKSLGNFITLEELFTGKHQLLEQAYSPMTIRFFILQTHYRSTLDFSNEALKAAEKGFHRLLNALEALNNLEYEAGGKVNEQLDEEMVKLCSACSEHMNDDLNTAQALARLFDLASKIFSFKNNVIPLNVITEETFSKMKTTFNSFVIDILGLKEEAVKGDSKTEELVQLLIRLRNEARSKKDFETADQIRNQLAEMNIELKDEKSGTTTWSMTE